MFFLCRIFFLAAFLSFGLIVNGQVQVYKSYSDYMNKKFESFEDVNYSNSSTLVFENSEAKTAYKYDDLWGFTFNKYLYRTNMSSLYQVMTYGKIVTYSDGEQALKLKKGKIIRYWTLSEVATTWISSGLNNDVYLTGFNPMNSKPPKKYRTSFEKFQADFPEHQKFYNCLDGSDNSNKLSECLSDYNDEAIQFEKKLIDLGEIMIDYKNRDQAKPFTATYVFKNLGKEAVFIENVVSKTDYAVASFPKGAIQAGAKGEIVITFDVQKCLSKDKPINSSGTYKKTNSNIFNVTFKNVDNIQSLVLKEILVLNN